MRRRFAIRSSFGSPFRREVRGAFRRSFRRAPRKARRPLLKDNGPTLHQVCNAISAYIRCAQRYEKKWNPPSRFKTIGTREERDRRMLEDLERSYGEKSPAARELEKAAAALAAPAAAPVTPAVPNAQPQTPDPQPPKKC